MDPALQRALVEAVQSVATPTWADIATALIAFLALIGTVVMAFLQNRIAKQQTIIAAKQADYLFGKELSEKIAGLCARLVLLVSLMEFPQADRTVYADRKENFCTYAREFEEQHMPQLEARLNIK